MLKIMLLFAEPLSAGSGLLMMLLILLVTTIVMAGGGYFALKLFAHLVNSRRDAWQETARALGLERQMEYHRLVKPLKGVYQTFQVEITHETRGETPDTICRVWLPTALPFNLDIKPQGYLSSVISSALGTTDMKIGIDGFDHAFAVGGSDEQAIQLLLNAYQPNDKAPNLIVDLLAASKAGYRATVSDTQVELRKSGECLEAYDIAPQLDAAIYLVKRIEQAREISAGEA